MRQDQERNSVANGSVLYIPLPTRLRRKVVGVAIATLKVRQTLFAAGAYGRTENTSSGARRVHPQAEAALEVVGTMECNAKHRLCTGTRYSPPKKTAFRLIHGIKDSYFY